MRRIARNYDGVGLIGLGLVVHSVLARAAWLVDFGSDSMPDRLLIFRHGYDPKTIACIRHSCFTILKQPVTLLWNHISSHELCFFSIILHTLPQVSDGRTPT